MHLKLSIHMLYSKHYAVVAPYNWTLKDLWSWFMESDLPLWQGWYVGVLITFSDTTPLSFVQLQTDCSQDQGPHTWALILAPACLPQHSFFFLNIAQNYFFSSWYKQLFHGGHFVSQTGMY